MEARAPYSGGSVQAAGATGPITTERLQEVQRHLAGRKPWPAFLHGGFANGCPDNVEEALAWMASGAVGFLNVADVGPLAPICEAFKGLILAAEGAAEADENLRELIAWCAFLTQVLLQHGKDENALGRVMDPLNAFVSTTNQLAERAERLATRRKCAALLCFARDGKQIQEFDTKLRKIWNDIQGLAILEFYAEFRATLPPKTGDIAKVPQKAPDLPPAFVERSELVDPVAKDLVATDRATGEAHVLRGIPGGGKTVAASSVVRCDEIRRSFKDGIFWVQVGQVGTGNPTALLKGLAEDLVHAPSNRPHTVPHEFRDAEHVITHLVGVLEQGNLRCLVVLDDVWDPQIVPLFLRTGFHCLVTTRDVAVVPRHLRGTCTPVDILTNNEALELLKNASRATSSIPRDEGLKVADDCGFLPLAIAIIGAMGSSRIDPHSPETWRGVHTRLVEEPTLVRDHVGGVLTVSFRELNEKARTRFRKLGVLVRGVRAPVDMVAHLWEQDPSDATLLISDLVDKSLVKVVEQSYYLHDLVLDFAKDELRKLGRQVQLITSRQAQYLGTISVLEGYARAGESLRGFYALMALWASVEDLSGDQQLEVRTYGVSLKAVEESEPTADFANMNWAAGRLFELQGKFVEAEPLYERSQAIREKVHGPEHEAVATSLNNRAGLLESQGKYEQAEPLYERAIVIWEAALGHEHAQVAIGLNNRAVLLKAQGKFTEADPLYLRAIEIRERVLGADHPDLAVSLGTRGQLLIAQGDYAGAEPLYRRAQEIFEKSFGPNHPHVATALSDRAGLLEKQGKYDEAGPLYERSLAIREKMYGPDHPAVATALNNRAQLLQAQGKYTDAEPLYERCQAIYQKSLGPEHPYVATTLNNRAGLLESQGKYEEAEPLYERSQAIREKVLGPEHPDVAQSLNNRAELLRAQGRYEEAAPLYERSQAIREKVLGPEHPDVAQSLNNRALLLENQGKYAEADPLYLRAIEIGEKTLGPDHPDLATRLNNRALLLEAQGKLSEAEPLYKRTQEIFEKSLGQDHPDVATILNNRALLLSEQGKYDEAGPLYGRSLAICEKALGPDHPDVAASLNNRAGLLESQGKYAEAEPLYKRATEVWEKALGPDHPTVATVLNNRAALLESQGKYEESGPLYARSLAIREKALGPDHPAVAESLNNRAGLLRAQGKFEEADPLYLRAVEIGEKTLGPDHPALATRLNNRAGLLRAQGKYSEAEPLYERSQAIREKVLGPEHPDVAQSLNNRAGLLESQGKYDDAEPLYVRAIAIGEKALGPEHPDLAVWLNNRAGLLESQGKHNEALLLLERASSIRRKKLGENHHDTIDTQISLERVQKHIREQETNTGPRGTKHPEEA